MGITNKDALAFTVNGKKMAFKEQVLLNAIFDFNKEHPGQAFSYSNKQIATDIFYLDPVVYNARYVSRIIGALVSKKLVKCVYIDDNPRNKRLDIVLCLSDIQLDMLIKEKEKRVEYEKTLVLENEKGHEGIVESLWLNQAFCYKYDLDIELGAIMSVLYLIHLKKINIVDGFEEIKPDLNGWFNVSNEMLYQLLPTIFTPTNASEKEKINMIEFKLKKLVEADMIEVIYSQDDWLILDRQIRLTYLGSQYFNK